MRPAKIKRVRALNPNQARFVAEYLKDLNATQACIRAGYSKTSARQHGTLLMANPAIVAAIEAAQEDRAGRTLITQDRVLSELALLAFSDVGHYDLDIHGNVTLTADAPKGARRAISSIKKRTTYDKEGNPTHEVELKLWDKPGPLKLAGQHVGLFTGTDPKDDQPTEIHVHVHDQPDLPRPVTPETTSTG